MSINSEKVKRARKKQQQRYKELKESLPCYRCGNFFPSFVTDFHHRDPAEKKFKVSKALCNTMSWSKILEEVEKCDLLCSNCHRFEEYEIIPVSSNGKTLPC